MAVGEAFLSAFLQVLFDRLASKHIIDIIRGHDIENDLKKLKKTLTKVEAFLNDEEDKQLKSKAVKSWLDDLKDAAYDAEDLLDEFTTEGLRRKVEADSQVWSSVPASLSPHVVSFNVRIESKIKGIAKRFDELANERFDLGLEEVAGGSSSLVRETNSVVDESGVYGRDNYKNRIVELLLKNEPKVSVIPIVGMGGVGKTTLAQILYNNDEVERNFDLPSHLKRCFAYCSLPPKGYEFKEMESVLLWMAEGLVQQPNERKQMEDLGVEYFHDLLSRSFFQPLGNDKSRFVMHDLINDLAQWVTGKTSFRLEDKMDGIKQCKLFENAHWKYT